MIENGYASNVFTIAIHFVNFDKDIIKRSVKYSFFKGKGSFWFLNVDNLFWNWKLALGFNTLEERKENLQSIKQS